MKSEIIALALAGSGGVFGVRSNLCGPIGGWIGVSASNPSSRNRHASASELKLNELARKKWRREQKNDLELLDIKESVCAQQRLAKAGERERLRIGRRFVFFFFHRRHARANAFGLLRQIQ